MLYATLSFAPAGVHSGAAGWTEQLNTLSGQDHMQERSVYLCTCSIYMHYTVYLLMYICKYIIIDMQVEVIDYRYRGAV